MDTFDPLELHRGPIQRSSSSYSRTALSWFGFVFRGACDQTHTYMYRLSVALPQPCWHLTVDSF